MNEQEIRSKAFRLLGRRLVEDSMTLYNEHVYIFPLQDGDRKTYIHIFWHEDDGTEHQVEVHETHISVIF